MSKEESDTKAWFKILKYKLQIFMNFHKFYLPTFSIN